MRGADDEACDRWVGAWRVPDGWRGCDVADGVHADVQVSGRQRGGGERVCGERVWECGGGEAARTRFGLLLPRDGDVGADDHAG